MSHVLNSLVGKSFRNFKSEGKEKPILYKVLAIAIDPDTNENTVVYRSLKSGSIYTLNAAAFTGMADNGKGKRVPRFTEVTDAEASEFPGEAKAAKKAVR